MTTNTLATPPENDNGTLKRRDFLKLAWGAVGALVLTEAAQLVPGQREQGGFRSAEEGGTDQQYRQQHQLKCHECVAFASFVLPGP